MEMTARELQNALGYVGMERNLRKLAINEKLSSVDNIATMSELDICDLVLKTFEVVSTEEECVTLVKKEDLPAYKKMVKFINR